MPALPLPPVVVAVVVLAPLDAPLLFALVKVALLMVAFLLIAVPVPSEADAGRTVLPEVVAVRLVNEAL